MEEDKMYLNKQGYDEYLKSIDELRKNLVKTGRDKSDGFSSSTGDGWHDNFAFEEAKRQELIVLVQIQKKLDGLKNIIIVEKDLDNEIVDIDNSFVIEIDYNGTKEIEEYKLVARTPDFLNGEVSINSPIGKAVYQKKVGETILYNANNNDFVGKVLKLIK